MNSEDCDHIIGVHTDSDIEFINSSDKDWYAAQAKKAHEAFIVSAFANPVFAEKQRIERQNWTLEDHLKSVCRMFKFCPECGKQLHD